MPNQTPHLKKAIIIRHRKDKHLCIRCGLDINENCKLNKCIENYLKADMRNISEPSDTPLTERKIITIKYYRKQKKLCLLCGKELHEGNCKEDYTRSDNRDKSDKEFRPAIIKTPKDSKKFIIDSITDINKPTVLLSKTKNIQLHRPSILISLQTSNSGRTIDFSCINQLSKKFSDYLIVLVGTPDKYFPYSDFLKLKKLVNILVINKLSNQEMINYLHSVKKYFSFENEFIDYCKRNKLQYYQFQNDKNASNVIPVNAYQII